MRRLVLGIAAGALISLSQPGMGAELKAKPARATGYDWSGVYAGVNFGYGWSSAHWRNTASSPAASFFDYTPGQSFSNDVSGVIGGAQIGINFRNGPWVFGPEAIFDASAIDGSFTSTTVFGAGDDQFKTRIDALFLLTGRIGYSWDNFLIYGKAGYALARLHASVNDATPPLTGAGDDRQWRSGPTVGIGAQYGITPELSMGVEYDYIHLNGGRYQLAGSAGNYLWNIEAHDVHVLMAKLDYRFGWLR